MYRKNFLKKLRMFLKKRSGHDTNKNRYVYKVSYDIQITLSNPFIIHCKGDRFNNIYISFNGERIFLFYP